MYRLEFHGGTIHVCEDRMQEDSCDKDVDNHPFLSKWSFNIPPKITAASHRQDN